MTKMNVWIGFDPREQVAYQELDRSIRKYNRFVNIRPVLKPSTGATKTVSSRRPQGIYRVFVDSIPCTQTQQLCGVRIVHGL